MKNKIGIVTCFNMNNVNYGNRLQAYALNKYLRDNFPECIIHTLIFNPGTYIIKTEKENLLVRILGRMKLALKGNPLNNKLMNRLKKCNDFSAKNIVLSDPIDIKELYSIDYDIIITGSDVVWYQRQGIYKPIMFLDFQTERPVKRVAYAASFGSDFIPEENITLIQKSLQAFDSISVREKSSIALLNSLGIHEVKHCIDPTLLIPSSQWERIEQVPTLNTVKNGFIFVYLLGSEKADRNRIRNIADQLNLKIVTIPFARGRMNKSDKTFGDDRIMDCSPEEWIWLIHHCEYVITDSFHGVIFSTIFKKKFIALHRNEYGINNRLLDFLNTIEEENKFIDLSSISSLLEMEWDYNKISKKIGSLTCKSKKYIFSALCK